jgi:hypothetical protein
MATGARVKRRLFNGKNNYFKCENCESWIESEAATSGILFRPAAGTSAFLSGLRERDGEERVG